MYIFILKKDLSNFDTSSILINSNYTNNKNGGRVFTQGEINFYENGYSNFDLNVNEEDDSLHFEKVINTYF